MATAGENRETALLAALIHVADTLVADFDLLDLLHRLTTDCVALFPADAAGLLVSDHQGTLRLVASSSEAARLVELFQLQADEGPCLDCYRSGRPVSAPDLAVGGNGHGSQPMPPRKGSDRCTRYRCACAVTPSAR